jgi:hypothetical protein
LPFTLHAYYIVVKTSTGATPYSLIYGMEAISPMEMEIPSLKILIDYGLEEAE